MNAALTAPAGPSVGGTNARLPLPVRKEIRALLPFWLVTALVPQLAMLTSQSSLLYALGGAVYVLGCIAMACQTFGQEIGSHTAPLLLAQPITRKQLWKMKMGVLAVALGSAAAAIILGTLFMLFRRWLTHQWDLRSLPSAQDLGTGEYWKAGLGFAMLALIPPVCCFCTTPWLTLLLRHTLAADVFSLAIPAIFWGLAFALTGYVMGGNPSADPVAVTVFAVLMIGYCAAGVLLGYRRFLRWETLEATGGDLSLPFRWPAWSVGVAGAALRHRPLLQLCVKEFRLQQWSLAVAGLSCAFWLALVLARWAKLELSHEWFPALAVMSGFVVCLVAGPLSCAEERQLGTLEWQLTLSVALWKQWLIKAGVALGMVLVFGVGVSLLQLWAAARLGLFPFKCGAEDCMILLVFVGVLTSLGIHASSVCPASIRAMGLAMTVLVGVFWLMTMLPVALHAVFGAAPWDGRFLAITVRLPPWFWLVVLACLSLTLLTLAYANFRKLAFSPVRYWKQAIAVFVIYGSIYLWGCLTSL